jgi:long-chain acyl-CoA synthetase
MSVAAQTAGTSGPVLTDFIGPVVREYGERPALRWREGYRHHGVTIKELAEAVGAASYSLHSAGVLPGNTVLLLGPSGPEWAVAFFGIVLAGGVVVPLDDTSRPEFVAEVARRVSPCLQITASGFPTAPGIRCLRMDAFHPLAINGPNSFGPPLRRPDDLLEIVYTSGTTSQPKGVMLTHNNVISNIAALSQTMGWSPGHRFLSVLPLSHMLGQVLGLLGPLCFGGTVFLAGTRRPSVLRECFRRERISVLVTVPVLLDRIHRKVLAAAAREGRAASLERAVYLAQHLPRALRRLLLRRVWRNAFPDLRFVFVGGASLCASTEDFFNALGIDVLQGYGMTEASPIITCNTIVARRSGTVGRALPGIDVRTSLDGEILVRGPNVSPGYWQDFRATDELLKQGWLHTGDLGRSSADGYWKILGRKKDVIIGPSGMNIYPEDVEQVLNRLPGVLDSCVVGLEDNGNLKLVGNVLLTDGLEWDAQRMLAQANDQLAAHQRLQTLERWPEPDFPRSRTLKVKRADILARLESRGREEPGTGSTSAPSTDHLLGMLRECLGFADGQTIGEAQRLAAELGLDSLRKLDLLSRIEERLGVELAESAIDEQTTVADLRCRIAERPSGIAQPAFPHWARRRPWVAVRRLLGLTWLPLFRWYLPLQCQGHEHLHNVSEPAIFIANHTSNLDTPALLAALPGKLRRRLAVAAASDHWFQSDRGFVGRLPGVAASLWFHAFPFSRSDAVEASLRYVGELVDDGWSVLLYPEGTRSQTGHMACFREGIGTIARAMQVPVIPVGLSGCFGALPKGRLIPRPRRIHVRFGEPYLPRLRDEPAQITALLEQRVRNLVAQVPAPS